MIMEIDLLKELKKIEESDWSASEKFITRILLLFEEHEGKTGERMTYEKWLSWLNYLHGKVI